MLRLIFAHSFRNTPCLLYLQETMLVYLFIHSFKWFIHHLCMFERLSRNLASIVLIKSEIIISYRILPLVLLEHRLIVKCRTFHLDIHLFACHLTLYAYTLLLLVFHMNLGQILQFVVNHRFTLLFVWFSCFLRCFHFVYKTMVFHNLNDALFTIFFDLYV